MDVLKELEGLLTDLQTTKDGQAALAEFGRLLAGKPKPRRHSAAPKVPAPPISVYATVTQNFLCVHCGHRWTRVHQLHKDEEFCATAANGRPMVIQAKAGTASYDCITSRCGHCNSVVDSWTESELRERYKLLLAKTDLTVCRRQ